MNQDSKTTWLQAAAASVVAVLLTLFGYALNHNSLSGGLFLLVPFCTGLSIAFMSKGKKLVAITAMTSLLLSLSILLIAGLEGLLCAITAFPILFLGIGLGSLVGHVIGRKFIHRHGNTTVVAISVASMSLAGWTNQEMESPESLQVSSRMKFNAPMERVWKVVIESGTVEGDSTLLRVLGLPIPYKCTLDTQGIRICYFEEGQIVQNVTKSDYANAFEVEIVEAFEVRPWLAFERASYSFTQHDNNVEVTRTDNITSTLRPRWYWSWFEKACVQLEHRYVMSSMKQKAENPTNAEASTEQQLVNDQMSQ